VTVLSSNHQNEPVGIEPQRQLTLNKAKPK